MKLRLFILFTFLCFVPPCESRAQCTEEIPCPEVARLNPVILGGGAAAPAACSSPTGGNLFNEGFEGTTDCDAGAGTENYCETGGFVESGTVDYHTATGSTTGNKCDYCARASSAGTASWFKIDAGSSIAEVYVKFYFRYSNATDGTTITIYKTTQDDQWNIAAYLTLNTWGGTDTLYQGTDSGSAYNVAPNTWYLVSLHIVQNSTSTFQLDAQAAKEFTAANYTVEYHHFGVIDAVTCDADYDAIQIGSSSF